MTSGHKIVLAFLFASASGQIYAISEKMYFAEFGNK